MGRGKSSQAPPFLLEQASGFSWAFGPSKDCARGNGFSGSSICQFFFFSATPLGLYSGPPANTLAEWNGSGPPFTEPFFLLRAINFLAG